MKGFTRDHKFHPINNTRKKKHANSNGSVTPITGVKLTKKINTNSGQGKAILVGITKSYNEQPTKIKKTVKKIILKKKLPSEDFIAKIETGKGEATFNAREGLTEKDFHALGEHEFQHLWFNDELDDDNKKFQTFIMQGNKIEPFAQDLEAIRGEIRFNFISGNFEKLMDLRLEYPDEINSLIREIEIRDKLGLKSDIINEEEFQKAKRLVDNLHRN